jgi:hypothetical protein
VTAIKPVPASYLSSASIAELRWPGDALGHGASAFRRKRPVLDLAGEGLV